MDRDLESRLAQAEIQRAKLHCSRFFKGQRTLVEELYQRIQDGEQRLPHDAHTQALLARESQVLWSSSSSKSPHRDSKGTTTSSRMSVRDLDRCDKTKKSTNACTY